MFPTYYPATATAPQQQGNAQADGPTQAGAQHMPGLNQQLQGLGVQPQAFNLKADEKSSHQGIGRPAYRIQRWQQPPALGSKGPPSPSDHSQLLKSERHAILQHKSIIAETTQCKLSAAVCYLDICKAV